jgi:steroid delta-isomerase
LPARCATPPPGPFTGRDAIERGYVEQPPDDAMTVLSVAKANDYAVDVAFVWDAGGAGTMHLRWVDELVAELVITSG